MKRPVRFKQVITGYRCHVSGCNEQGVWYVETKKEFFHWCKKHAVARMKDSKFWAEREEDIVLRSSGRKDSGGSRQHPSTH